METKNIRGIISFIVFIGSIYTIKANKNAIRSNSTNNFKITEIRFP